MGSLLEIKRHVKEGSLAPALAEAKASVRDDPGDPTVRTALFTLFAAAGEWRKAADQLKAVLNLGGDPSLIPYGALIDAAVKRRRVFSGEDEPAFPGGNRPPWADRWLAALRALASGDPQALADVAEERVADLDRIRGSNAELEFEGFRNCDTRLAGFLEGVFEGEYGWIPVEDVLRLMVPERPELMQDFLWLPVMLHLRAGRPMKAYLHATTPGTDEHGSDSEKLGRSVGWDEDFEEIDIARGVQMFALGAEVVPIFQLGQCCFNHETAEEEAVQP